MATKRTDPAVQKWLKTISDYDKEFKRWEGRVTKIVKIYRDFDGHNDTRNGTTQFNILWSNVQTCIPAVFARLPKPDVSRRFRDNDPVGRVAALLLERALEYEIEHYPDYAAAMENCVLDRFLGGRGTAWVRYEPHFRAVEEAVPTDGIQTTEDIDEVGEELDYECAPVDYVHWKDFGHNVARTWEEVSSVWRKVYMERPALVERFGEELGSKIPLDTRPDDSKRGSTSPDTENYQACIYEIWDKTTNKAIWLSKSLGQILDERDDPLELENFFPCGRPLFATITNDSLLPVPDYKLYQDQAQELNTLADRIDGLIKALQVKGVHDAAIPELARLFKEAGNGDLIPVKNWAAFSEKNGLRGAIDIYDITPIARALVEAYNAVDHVKAQIYEIMGISDILRGSTDPRETLGAQAKKVQFGSLRLQRMQRKVVDFATELIKIKAQIICKHFSPETIARIGGAEMLTPQDKALVPHAIDLIRNAPLRSFRVEVSSDSMVALDEQQEKADRTECLAAIAGFLQQAVPAAQASPEMTPLLMEMLKFGIGAFKAGKTLEGVLDEFADKAKQMAANPQPKPDPEAQKLQAQMQAKQMEMQVQTQFEMQKMQMEERLELSRQQYQAAEEQKRNELEAARAQQQAQLDAQLETVRQQHSRELEELRGQIQLLIASANNQTKLEVAEIQSQTTLQSAQTSAAENATGYANE